MPTDGLFLSRRMFQLVDLMEIWQQSNLVEVDSYMNGRTLQGEFYSKII
jgi:hypothetical protein